MDYLNSQILIPILIAIPSCTRQLGWESETDSLQRESSAYHNVVIWFAVRIGVGIGIRIR